MNLIHLLSKRLDELERDRTGFPPRPLRYGGLWLGVPVLFALVGLLIKWDHNRRYFDAAGAGVLWLGFILVAAAFVFGCSFYQDRVPIKIQLVVDLVAWSVLGWMFFHFRFWEA
jgi:hypothetical protein